MEEYTTPPRQAVWHLVPAKLAIAPQGHVAAQQERVEEPELLAQEVLAAQRVVEEAGAEDAAEEVSFLQSRRCPNKSRH